MSPLQIAGLLFIAVFPLTVRWHRRGREEQAARRRAEKILALALVFAFAGDLAYKVADGQFRPAYALPLQLCDWALAAVAIALWTRSARAFDLAYFWGLAGTLQALFTPAIARDLFWLRQLGFFFIHGGIVAGVLHLVLNDGLRPHWPRSLIRIFIASEIYFLVCLSTNALTGANYGFLSHKPSTPSLLDFFSGRPWLYALQMNATGLIFFFLLYLPWWWVDARSRRHKPA